MDFNPIDTAVLVTDPQNDFLSETGVTWDLFGDSITENKTVENIERIFKAANNNGFPIFISPHYYYPTDHEWQFVGTLEGVMHQIKMFDRIGPVYSQRSPSHGRGRRGHGCGNGQSGTAQGVSSSS